MRRYAWLILLISTAASPALACPNDQYESCFLGACACFPKIGGAVGKAGEDIKHGVNQVLTQTWAQSAGAALEQALIASRNTAVGTSQPIPPEIRAALQGFIDDDVLNRVRFKVGDNGLLNVANLTLTYGDSFTGGAGVAAVTLIDVIVFHNESDANSYPGLWAHELTHVKQFRDWGTHDFAIRYARNSSGVENEAIGVANNYAAWRAARAAPPPQPAPFPPPPPPVMQGFPSGYAMTACGCFGPFPVQVALEPRCQSGGVRLVTCAGYCPTGGVPYGYVCQ
jgi:hypothetical protein